MDKLSYGLGLGIGQQLLQMNIEGLELDDFFAAIKDVLTGRQPQVDHHEAQKIVSSYFQKKQEQLEKEREAEAEEKKEEAEAKRKELEEEQEVLSGDYILPESSARYYSEEEVQSLTDREVLFALNEIYARKGRIFTGEEFRSYFESKSWYKGTIPAEEFDANQNERFNEYEKANISLLVKVAEERGLR